MTKENRWKDRRVQGYPPPIYCKLTAGYAAANGLTESKVVSQAVKEFFDRMPKEEQSRFLNVSKHAY